MFIVSRNQQELTPTSLATHSRLHTLEYPYLTNHASHSHPLSSLTELFTLPQIPPQIFLAQGLFYSVPNLPSPTPAILQRPAELFISIAATIC